MEILWQPANRKNKAILFYGYAKQTNNVAPVRTVSQEIDYKIENKAGWFLAYRKEGKKYILLDNFKSLRDCQGHCLFDLRQRGEK